MQVRLFIMRIRLTIIFLALFQVLASAAPGNIVKGVVRDASSGEPITGAVLKLDDGAMWAVTDLDGKYTISVSNGKYILTAECLGYVPQSIRIHVKAQSVEAYAADGSLTVTDFTLHEESLALDEVTVTAQRPAGTMGTSHNIGKEALEHLQMTSMSDMAALLPGGKTVNPDLTKDNSISLRDGGTTAGNAAFGTALEVDGVRIGNNAGMGELAGAGTRSIAVDNIESIEVITGVPSAEYGDLNSGMVKVNLKKGRSPLNLVFSTNPRTYQTSLSKGIDLKNNNGVLNISGEWTRATQKLISPYTSYTRRNVSATYSNTFNRNLRFEIGATANIGGMNSKDDPDASNGNTERVRDNAFRGNTALNWMLNKAWITSLKAEASVSFADNMARSHTYCSSASTQPAVHATEQGYHFADMLPLSYYADKVTDSKELDYAASLKYDWTRSFGPVKNRLKAGIQFKASGNTGLGEYYENPDVAPNGYRSRPYNQYPFMNNLSEYIEDQITVPVGNTRLEAVAGLRFEQVFIEGSQYRNVNSLSPRFNVKWSFTEHVTLRGGWGVSEKLPSFWVLYPKQEYLDIQTFAFSSGSNSHYVYYTVPYQILYNPDLKWQRNYNSEFAVDLNFGDWKLSAVGFYNITKNPYYYQRRYTVTGLNMLALPQDFVMPENPQYKVDSQSGMVYMRGSRDEYWMPMDIKVADRTFVRYNYQTNGKPVFRAGAELTLDCPQIKPIRTSFRIDARYSYSSYVDDTESYNYNDNWMHSSLQNRSYEYVGIYARGSSKTTVNGRITHGLDANITSITHIPEARLVFTVRFEAAILRRSLNISSHDGREYAHNVAENSHEATGGSIYDGDSYAEIWPVAYMDLDGQVHPFTEEQASDPAFGKLMVRTYDAYTYRQDGYGFYCSANFSVTKEIGRHVSLSFFANNFTASRPAVTSMATGVSSVFTPEFYYGLTCRLKF